MCIEMTQSPMAVFILQDGATVTVNGVPMIFTVPPYPSAYVYFTTADSDIDAFHKRDAEEMAKLDKDDPHYNFIVKHMGECYYDEYIKHVRQTENGSSGFTREELFKLFTTNQFVIA
jgi:hypothetical protein